MLTLPAPLIDDWASVDWLYVAVLAVFVFFSTLIGVLLSFKRAFVSALLSTLLFAAAFVLWTYYPHGLPLPISVAAQKAATPATPAAPATPSSPVTPLSPPPSSPPGNSQ